MSRLNSASDQLSFDYVNPVTLRRKGRSTAIQRVHIDKVAEFNIPDHISAELEECAWSASVALDPKHRPQTWDRPSRTLRREWCRYPQEAHLFDEEGWRYRRLTSTEMAILQGFEPSWFDVPRVPNLDRIRAIGDAVPPPLARAIFGAIDAEWKWQNKLAIEICAGSGGLASAVSDCTNLTHELLVERWPTACAILKHSKPWKARSVLCEDVRQIDFSKFAGSVGLLSGGPPCQPWSQAGLGEGANDERDLLSSIHHVIAELKPEVFVFENVPGLVSEQNYDYFRRILQNLRAPDPGGGLRYGVTAGILNAADFGVPQIRRRVFFLGFRDQSDSFAYRVFDRVHAAATHRDPIRPDASRLPWVTLREAFAGLPDPGGWRRWIAS